MKKISILCVCIIALVALTAWTSNAIAVCTADADCDDTQFCNGAETCDTVTGTCQPGTPVDCDDGVDCTVDTCDEVNDTCVNTPDDASCDDGDVCNGLETCDPVNDCQPGEPLVCDDGNPCTDDSCGPVPGCVFTPVDCPDGEQCDQADGFCKVPSIAVGDPIIDTTTQGDWREVYGNCFVLIPNPTQLSVKELTGPDFFSQIPAQYDNACFEGLLLDPPNDVDWRIFKTNGGPTPAFAWLNEGSFSPAPGAAQWNPCINNFKAATWDDADDANDPLVLELEINFTGSIKLAYYFLNAEDVCRFEEFRLFINDEMLPRKVGMIGDFESGIYLIFDIEDLVGETAIRLEVSLVETVGCYDTDTEGLNSHLSGVFINCVPALNLQPVANAGSDQTAECTSHSGTPVTLDGSASFDPDGDPLTYLWSATGISFDDPTSPTPTGPFPLGTTTATLVVYDLTEGSDPDTTDITVQDTIAPAINSFTANPSELWPPNHKMVSVTMSVSPSDVCDTAPVCKIKSVSSNEPEDGLGDGRTTPDLMITGDLTVDLRAERSGTGSGRDYTITVECTDASGNSSTETVVVIVPRDKGKKK